MNREWGCCGSRVHCLKSLDDEAHPFAVIICMLLLEVVEVEVGGFFFFFFFFLNKVYRIGLTISSVWVLFTAEGGNSFFRSKSLQALWRAVMSLSQPQLQTWLFGLSRWLAATSSSPLTTNITGTMWMHLLSLSLCMEVQLHVYDRWACTHAKWECRPPLKGFLWCWLLPSIARFLLHDDSLARFDELGFLAMQ